MNFGNETFTRRGMLRLMGGAGAAAATGGLLLRTPATAAGGPLEAVIDVTVFEEWYNGSTPVTQLYVGDLVENFDPLNPEVVNGYRHIRVADGRGGWVLDYALEPADALPEDPVFNIIRFLTRQDDLLVDPYGEVIATLPFGTQVETSTTLDGEFVLGRGWLESGPVEGWVRNWLLTPDTARVYSVVLLETGAVAPMVAEPYDGAAWVADIPDGSKVIDYDGEVVDGYRGVESEFGTGWISQEYLGVG